MARIADVVPKLIQLDFETVKRIIGDDVEGIHANIGFADGEWFSYRDAVFFTMENDELGKLERYVNRDPRARRIAAMDNTPAKAIVLVQYAMDVRMYGERAPGGKENWADWDVAAEGYLRALKGVDE